MNGEKVIEATGIDDALDALDDEKGVKHPEKKVKAVKFEFISYENI